MATSLRDLQPPPAARRGAPAAARPRALRRPRVVIVGAGFGGLAAASALGGADAEVTVIDRRNYHLFQPLRYQVATAALSPADIAQPIRSILKRQRNASVLLGRGIGIDTAARAVLLDERRVPPRAAYREASASFEQALVALMGMIFWLERAKLEARAAG